MNRFVFLLLVVLSSPAYATTWQTDAITIECSKATTSPQTTWNWGCAIIRASDGFNMANISMVGNNNAANYTMVIPAQSRSDQFYLCVYAAYNTNYNVVNSNGMKWRWVSSYTGAGISANGPFTSGNPTDNDGNPANPATGDSVAPKNYSQTVTLNNSSNSVAGFQCTMTDSIGRVLGNKNYFLEPNSSKVISFNYNVPFTVSVYGLTGNEQFDTDGNSIGTAWTRSSSSPTQTLAAAGNQNAPVTTPTMAETSSNNTLSPSATAASQQAQILAGSDEITGAVKDSTAQMRQLGDKMDNANAKLTGIKDGVDGVKTSVDSTRTSLGSKLDALNNTETASGNTLSGIKSALTAGLGTGTAETVTENNSATTYANSLGTRISGLQGAFTGLVSAAGLGGGLGTAPLSWSVGWQDKNYEITLEPYSSYIADARSVELWAMGVFFLYAIYGVIRGTFAEEKA
ncbi:MAG: hypothetical protein J0L73_23535 [Verrucomicrobia bacterium]|nr:hypothetical protein [Verrucomicrobiota bacterium]